MTMDNNSSSDSSSSSQQNNNLHSLNKLSHKISKPNNSVVVRRPHALEPQAEPAPLPPQQQQPPVYNINKSDFRELVQKLTGSPAHHHHQPAPPKPTSRLHLIRPPPLAQISLRPPNSLSCAAPPHQAQASGHHQLSQLNCAAPPSPLPPFPAVHAAAESPISAYMRYLNSAMPLPPPQSPMGFGCLSPLFSPSTLSPKTLPVPSPRWKDH